MILQNTLRLLKKLVLFVLDILYYTVFLLPHKNCLLYVLDILYCIVFQVPHKNRYCLYNTFFIVLSFDCLTTLVLFVLHILYYIVFLLAHKKSVFLVQDILNYIFSRLPRKKCLLYVLNILYCIVFRFANKNRSYYLLYCFAIG